MTPGRAPVQYRYDAAGQLIHSERGERGGASYGYDACGNVEWRGSSQFVYSRGDKLIQAGDRRFEREPEWRGSSCPRSRRFSIVGMGPARPIDQGRSFEWNWNRIWIRWIWQTGF